MKGQTLFDATASPPLPPSLLYDLHRPSSLCMVMFPIFVYDTRSKTMNICSEINKDREHYNTIKDHLHKSY
jgi:hypothetical protein